MIPSLSLILAWAVGVFGGPAVDDGDAPVMLRSTESRYEVEIGDGGDVVRGPLRRLRVEHRDEQGRLVRWEEREPEGADGS